MCSTVHVLLQNQLLIKIATYRETSRTLFLIDWHLTWSHLYCHGHIIALIPVRMPHPCRAPAPQSTELQRDPRQSFSAIFKSEEKRRGCCWSWHFFLNFSIRGFREKLPRSVRRQAQGWSDCDCPGHAGCCSCSRPHSSHRNFLKLGLRIQYLR